MPDDDGLNAESQIIGSISLQAESRFLPRRVAGNAYLGFIKYSPSSSVITYKKEKRRMKSTGT
jgi:hypothetical protein